MQVEYRFPPASGWFVTDSPPIQVEYRFPSASGWFVTDSPPIQVEYRFPLASGAASRPDEALNPISNDNQQGVEPTAKHRALVLPESDQR